LSFWVCLLTRWEKIAHSTRGICPFRCRSS